MSMMRRYDPFQDMLSLRDAMSQLMEEAFVSSGRRGEGAVGMPMDLRETDDAFVVEASLPGVRAEDIDITLQENVLVINAECRRQQPEGQQQGTTHRQERYYGRFTRAISLPSQVNAEQVQATLDQGILRLEIPKAEQVKPRRIAVQGGAGQQARTIEMSGQNQGGSAQSAQDQQRQVGG